MINRRKNITAQEYNDKAVEYDSMSRKAIPWIYFDKPFLKKKLSPMLTKKTKLLELGCGGGKVIETLDKAGLDTANVMGVDISKQLIKLAHTRIPKAQFVVGDMSKIKLPDNSFDIALSVRSVEYLDLKRLESFFKNVYASLKKDGVLVIVTGHPLRVNDGDISKYLMRGRRIVNLPWGMKVTLYHKTISDYLSAALSEGFLLDFIDEPKMPAAIKKVYPEKYQKYMSYGGATNLHMVFKKP